MAATAQAFDGVEAQETAVASRVDVQREDAYWERCYLGEGYYSPGLDYEDFAPAYCVGYIGYAQYGGAFSDAESSLKSNWVRIKGDSRLSLEQAVQAMQAAWTRMAGGPSLEAANDAWGGGPARQPLPLPSFALRPTLG